MKTTHFIEVYRDRQGKHRWRIRARNRRIVANGGEPFASRRNAIRACRRVVANSNRFVVAAVAPLRMVFLDK